MFQAHLETVIRQLELEKVRLESALQQEQQKVEMYQRDVNDSQQVRNIMYSEVYFTDFFWTIKQQTKPQFSQNNFDHIW